MADNLSKKIILSGGAGFLGTAYTCHFLNKGHSVLVIDNNKKNINMLLKKTNYDSKLKVVLADVSSYADTRNLFRKIKKNKSFYDILINNAAIDSVPTSRKQINDNFNISKIKKEIDVSIIGSYLLTELFYRHSNKKKKIINIGSDLSVIAPDQNIYKDIFPGYVKPISYSLIKHAILGMTKYYASLLSKKQIPVNMISPGPIYNNHKKAFQLRLKKIIPMQRMGNVNDLFSALDFLIDDATGYMTGQNIIIDGGRTIV